MDNTNIRGMARSRYRRSWSGDLSHSPASTTYGKSPTRVPTTYQRRPSIPVRKVQAGRPVPTMYDYPPTRKPSVPSYRRRREDTTRGYSPSKTSDEPVLTTARGDNCEVPARRLGYASETYPAPSVRSRRVTQTMRSQSPPSSGHPTQSRSIECKAMLTPVTHRCNLQLSPEFTVDDAISQATTQVLRNIVESHGSLGSIGETLSVAVLPSAAGTTTVGEWLRMNMDRPPVIVVESDTSDDLVAQKQEVNSETWGKTREDQAQMVANLQKLLQAQTQTIERQAAFIDELQARDKKVSEIFSKAVSRVQADITGMKGDLLQLEERVVSTNVENGKHSHD